MQKISILIKCGFLYVRKLLFVVQGFWGRKHSKNTHRSPVRASGEATCEFQFFFSFFTARAWLKLFNGIFFFLYLFIFFFVPQPETWKIRWASKKFNGGGGLEWYTLNVSSNTNQARFRKKRGFLMVMPSKKKKKSMLYYCLPCFLLWMFCGTSNRCVVNIYFCYSYMTIIYFVKRYAVKHTNILKYHN